MVHVALLFLAPGAALYAAVPAGFTETLVAGGLANPTAMAFAPDGRLFVSAGTHTLTIGGYNNKKTFNDEVTEVLVDDVVVR